MLPIFHWKLPVSGLQVLGGFLSVLFVSQWWWHCWQQQWQLQRRKQQRWGPQVFNSLPMSQSLYCHMSKKVLKRYSFYMTHKGLLIALLTSVGIFILLPSVRRDEAQGAKNDWLLTCCFIPETESIFSSSFLCHLSIKVTVQLSAMRQVAGTIHSFRIKVWATDLDRSILAWNLQRSFLSFLIT